MAGGGGVRGDLMDRGETSPSLSFPPGARGPAEQVGLGLAPLGHVGGLGGRGSPLLSRPCPGCSGWQGVGVVLSVGACSGGGLHWKGAPGQLFAVPGPG